MASFPSVNIDPLQIEGDLKQQRAESCKRVVVFQRFLTQGMKLIVTYTFVNNNHLIFIFLDEKKM